MTIEAIIIDGNDFTADLASRDDLSIEISKDQTSFVVALGLTNELVLVGGAYQYLLAKFYTDCTGIGTSAFVRIVSDCCDVDLVFELKGENLSMNGKDCEAAITLLTISDALKKYNRLRSRTWWQNERVRNGYHDKIKYIDKPSFWQRITGGNRDWGESKYHSFHICPLMHPIIEYNCELVGLQFQSQSVFDQYAEYKQLGLVLSQFREGRPVEEDGLSTDPNWRDEVAPVQTTIELLSDFAGLFNADIEITSTTLLFERSDWWEMNAQVLLDINTEISKDNIGNFSGIQSDLDKNYAFARFQYADDQTDTSARRVKWVFSDIVEWNENNDPSLKGSLEVVVPFSLPHCVGDQGYYELLRSGGEAALALRQIWGDLIGEPQDPVGNAWESGNQAYFDRHIMFMETGISQYPKLILVPRVDDPQLVDPPQPGSHIPPKYREQPFGVDIYGEPLEANNLPLIIDLPGGRPAIGNICEELSFREDVVKGLYHRFYEVDSTKNSRRYIITELEWFPDDFCGAWTHIQANGMRTGIDTTYGTVIPDSKTGSITVDFGEKKIVFKNLVGKRSC